MSELFIGLISGTSVDGIDAVLADFAENRCKLVGARTFAIEPRLRSRIEALINSPTLTWQQFGTCDAELGERFAAAALKLLRDHGVAPAEVTAIGHHGQTVHHSPTGEYPFTIQIADPARVAARTGITTIADMRRGDMARGGQGAPLVPAFHDWLLRSRSEARVVLNIGGIANITTLVPGEPIIGFDTGPGNTLLDAWTALHKGEPYDEGGAWSAQGQVNAPLLDSLLGDPWFDLPPPKSTGRELFNLRWLQSRSAGTADTLAPGDVQATLAELTAVSIARAIHAHAPQCRRVIVCGGGACNADLMTRLRRHCPCIVESSQAHGADPAWIEGLAFAWLARERLALRPGNVPSVTGAQEAVTLGGIYSGKTNL